MSKTITPRKLSSTKSRRQIRANRCLSAVTRALDRALASPHNEEDGVLRSVASMLIDLGNPGDAFLGRDGWSSAAMRGVVLEYARKAPVAEQKELAELAKLQYDWVVWWDTEGHAESDAIEHPRRAA
jgi:hypothetical protein